MVNTIFHQNRSKFLRQYSSLLTEHYYFFHPLLNFLCQEGEGSVKVHCIFTMTDGDDLVIGVQGGPCVLLYSLGWNDALLSEIQKQVRLDRMPENLLLSGTHDLIDQLLAQSERDHELISTRNVYECRTVSSPASNAPGQGAKADVHDIEAISRLSWSFQREEFGDRFEHGLDYMRTHVVIPGIINGNIAKWTDRGQIVSIAQVMFSDEEEAEGKPEIGHFYTVPDHRGRGYGSALIRQVTRSLLQDFGRCGLVTKRDNAAANAVFQKAGYELRNTWQKVRLL